MGSRAVLWAESGVQGKWELEACVYQDAGGPEQTWVGGMPREGAEAGFALANSSTLRRPLTSPPNTGLPWRREALSSTLKRVFVKRAGHGERGQWCLPSSGLRESQHWGQPFVVSVGTRPTGNSPADGNGFVQQVV